MAGILAYLPGGAAADKQRLIDVGLRDLLDPAVDAVFTEVRSGPDGGAGWLVTFCGLIPDTPRSYDADSQTWLDAPPDGELPRGRYWLGYVTAQKPSAGDLQRATVFDGEPVVLRDQNVWLVPVAEYLPKRLTRDRATGEEIEVVAEEHCEFVKASNALLDLFLSAGFLSLVKRERVVHIPRGLVFAGDALAKNYRVNADVIDLLDLVHGHEAFEIAWASCRGNALARAHAEKKSMESACPVTAPNSMPTCSAAG